MNTNDDLIFDDDAAVQFIIKHLPEDIKGKISDDDITYILDVMYDFYEENGFINEDTATEADIDEEAMFFFIKKTMQKDKVVSLTDEELQAILDGEFEYGKSIGVYK